MRFETVATMSLATSIAIYFIIWWVVLFAVLPWGVRSQDEQGTITPGSDPGAPAIPNLKRKLIWTTIVAAAVFELPESPPAPVARTRKKYVVPATRPVALNVVTFTPSGTAE